MTRHGLIALLRVELGAFAATLLLFAPLQLGASIVALAHVHIRAGGIADAIPGITRGPMIKPRALIPTSASEPFGAS
jgi:hypothetical protein